MFRTLIVAVLCLLSPGLAAGADTPAGKASRFYENAVKRFNDADYAGAVIQLKNALKEDPRLLPAHVLLGKSYVATGNGSAAETALNEALALGADPALTVVPLARAFVQQFKHAQLLSQPIPQGLPLVTRAELLTVKARAAMTIDDEESLNTLLAEIERFDPHSIDALNIKASIALESGRFDVAEKLVEQAMDVAPDNVDTLLTSASLKHARNDVRGALVDYSRVIELDPENVPARIARVALLLALGQPDATGDDLEALEESAGLDPRVDYLRAVKLRALGDEHGTNSALNEAADAIELLGQTVVARNPQLLMVSGLVHYHLTNLETAKGYLESYVAGRGDDLRASTVLGRVLVELGEYTNAVKLLERVVRQNPAVGSDILVLLAEAYSGAGRHGKATAILQRAASMRPKDSELATRLALARAHTGQTEAALADLESVFSENAPGRSVAGLQLALMHLNREDFARAREVATELYAAAPENLTFINLLGISEVGSGDLAAARTRFEKALSIDPGFVPAHLNLGKIERLEGDYPAATKRFNQLLGADPGNAQTMLELARTALAAGNEKRALTWAKDAAAAAPDSFDVAMFLIERYVAAGDFDAASDVAWDQGTAHPENLYVLEAQVNILLAKGDPDGARGILKRMGSLAEFNVGWLITVGDHQMRAGFVSDAHYTFSKAVQADVTRLEPRYRLAEIEIGQGKFEQASEKATALIADFPNSPFGHIALGDLRAARGLYPEAAESFSAALALRPERGDFALRLHQALRFAGDPHRAESVLTDWLARDAEAHWARKALADHLRNEGDLAAARDEYVVYLGARPTDVSANNNLAIVYSGLGETTKALAHARKAHDLAPANPFIADTLGWLLVNSDKVEEGLRLLREARARASNVAEIRYHLAVALNKQGRDKEALAEVQAALESEQPFEGREEAEKLERELRALNA